MTWDVKSIAKPKTSTTTIIEIMNQEIPLLNQSFHEQPVKISAPYSKHFLRKSALHKHYFNIDKIGLYNQSICDSSNNHITVAYVYNRPFGKHFKEKPAMGCKLSVSVNNLKVRPASWTEFLTWKRKYPRSTLSFDVKIFPPQGNHSHSIKDSALAVSCTCSDSVRMRLCWSLRVWSWLRAIQFFIFVGVCS